MFREEDITLPQVLKSAGYATACIGKWHLGWDFNFTNEPSGERTYYNRTRKVYLPEDIDWTLPVGGGPLDRGFDYYFGDGTINFPPYCWIKNDRVLEAPTEMMEFDEVGYEIKEGNWEFRVGPKVKDWNPYEVLPTLSEKSVEYIKSRQKDQPFFLYFALPSPHAPIIPNDEFDGKSEAGAYGDFVFQSDWVAGQVLEALKEMGFEDNTIVIFSADNGPERYAFERARNFNHFSMGDLRGLKRDVWEGGHHVPFLVKWPGKIREGSTSDELISQIDIMATLASAVGLTLPEDAAPDSYDFLPVLTGDNYESPLREATVHNTNKNIWGLRKGDWLYINKPSGGISKMPDFFKELRSYTDFETEGLLFNMKEDPEQRINLFEQYPDKVDELKNALHSIAGEKMQ
jgi:arylsulfatase A-like enzyme